MTEPPATFTDFVALLGHELRSPMNGVLGFAQLLRDDGERTETELKYLEQILFNAELQVRRVTNLIDLAQAEQGALYYKADPTPVSDVLRFAIETVLDEAASRSVSVKVAAPDSDLVADADRMRILQILVDILSNAVRFSKTGTTVEGGADLRDDGFIEITISNETDDPGDLNTRSDWKSAYARAVQNDENIGLGLPHATVLLSLMGGSLHTRYRDGRLQATLCIPAAV
ncbi:MAG: HAMP domain-containing sensor histidine kinase [Alphaproteobacteria bacterium]